MSDRKIRVSWGQAILPKPKPCESVEDRAWREAGDEAWLEKLRSLGQKALDDLRREVGE